jgi:tetratricopeptide (TPR) repeat protein
LETQRQLDRTLKATRPAPTGRNHDGNKLTLEKNSAILREIKQKSDAAKVLNKMPAGHKEVFEMCDRYISIAGNELKTIGAGSPRLAPLIRGREMAEEFHKFHLLQWAEIETRSLMQEARHLQKFNEKLALAQKAVAIVDSALDHYPDDENLQESGEALKEFVASIKISNWVERAEKAAFKGNYKQAKKLYNDALFFVQREVPGDENRQIAVAKITDGLTKLNDLKDATE